MQESVEGFNFDKITMDTFDVLYALGQGVSFWFFKLMIKCPRVPRTANIASVDEISSRISAVYSTAKSPQLWPSGCFCTGRNVVNSFPSLLTKCL